MSDTSSLRSENLGKSKKKKNNFIIPSFIFDVLIIACLAVFAYYLRFTSTFNAFNRYFLCVDPDLQYPYYGGEGKGEGPVSDSVTIYVDDVYFYCLATLIPPFVILIGELLYMCLTPPNPKILTTCCNCFRVPLVLRRLCRHVGVFWLGFLLLSILTDSLKLLSGRQRPYFLNIPDIEQHINTTDTPYCIVNSSINDTIRDASLSFPSYHSALGTYAAAFAICFVQVMFDVHGSYFFRPILSAGFAGMSMLASYTQWMLYRNAWVDIVFGSAIGLLVALYMCFCIVNGFEEHMEREEHDHRGGLLGGPGAERPLEEARPAIFRWVNIPRLTMRAKRRPPNHYNYGNTGFPDDVNRGHQLY